MGDHLASTFFFSLTEVLGKFASSTGISKNLDWATRGSVNIGYLECLLHTFEAITQPTFSNLLALLIRVCWQLCRHNYLWYSAYRTKFYNFPTNESFHIKHYQSNTNPISPATFLKIKLSLLWVLHIAFYKLNMKNFECSYNSVHFICAVLNRTGRGTLHWNQRELFIR